MAAMTAIALGLALGGSYLSARGQWKAGAAEKQAGLAEQRAKESEGSLYDFNAKVAELQATDAVARGREEENRFRQRIAGTIGEQRAGTAASNIDVGFGSAVDVQADSAFLGELDALTIRTNAAREAWGYKTSAEDLKQRGAIARQEGSNLAAAGASRQTAMRYGAVGTVIGAGASLLEARYGFGKKGKAA